MNKLLEFSKVHSDAIMALAAIVQTAVAVLMLISLILTRETLQIAQRQLEASVEPVLEVSYNQTNKSIATFTNSGTVSISDLEIVGMIRVLFDAHYNVKDCNEIAANKVLAETLSPHQGLNFDFSKLLDIPRPVSGDANAKGAVSYVVRYRRSIDMKPKFKLIVLWGVYGEDGKIFMYMPADSFGSTWTMYSPDGGPNPVFQMKRKIKSIFKDIDIPVDDSD